MRLSARFAALSSLCAASPFQLVTGINYAVKRVQTNRVMTFSGLDNFLELTTANIGLEWVSHRSAVLIIIISF